MKRFYGSLFSVIVILAVSVNPVFAASKNYGSAQKTVTASAVVVPAQVSELGFVISGIAKDIPVKEGDTVKAGQALMVLDTPESQFAVTEAQANLRAAQSQLEIRQNEIRKKYIIYYGRETITLKK